MNIRNNIINIGRNKFENDKLFDDADDNDTWFHIKDEPSAHLWINTCTFNKSELYNIGLQLKKRSKFKKSNFISVIYTTKHNLIKTESIGKIKIIGKYKTINI